MNALRNTARFLCGVILTLGMIVGVGPTSQTHASNPSPARTVAVRTEIGALKGDFFAERFTARMNRLSTADQQKFAGFYNPASSLEKYYLTRAFAAGHSLQDLEAFAGVIRGKSEDWLRNSLRLTSSTRWFGIKQQWRDSCAPTTVMALLGEIDPMFALRVHRDNPNFYEIDELNPGRVNPKLADEQKRLLETTLGGEDGGKAVPRKTSGGVGRWYGELLNTYSTTTGLRYTLKVIGPGYTVDQALRDMEVALSKGIPVPLVVKAKTSTHAVLATAKWTNETGTGFNIHEPWEGRTTSRSPDQFRNGALDLAGNNTLLGIYVPTIDRI